MCKGPILDPSQSSSGSIASIPIFSDPLQYYILIYHVKIATCMLIDTLVLKIWSYDGVIAYEVNPSIIGNIIIQ